MRRLLTILLLCLAGCGQAVEPLEAQVQGDSASGQLSSRPAAPTSPSAETGLRRFGSGPRAALLHVPKSYSVDKPAPLIVMLHGAGGTGRHSMELVTRHAERLGFLVLAPSSSAASWDIISGRSYGPDVAPLDSVLKQVFAQYAVDPKRLAIGGFSDGASYALSLGIINGALFTDILAFSPGFMAPTRAEGQPRIFISHGTDDRVLPIDVCSRKIVPRLEAGGYSVDYREFHGGHTVPADLARAAYEAFAT